ncbi:hypothetical protein TSACC_21718 [Terrimicrobium sacchariphilum]|uniref:Uncharacterized protein n=1 Tax=Terrimicrobium sacchariphilum TaxID=690879 RepID=A0A146G6D6_TERSA|nr:hypothetical protein [Terrimicrobium sacchariphilum]GAT33305.1 hypothetical protein TSACC_21718 [Terrimicrobium sacchariphilum]
MTDELKAAAQAGDRFANIILMAYKLGGWGVLALSLLVALRYVWDERALTSQALISELREGKQAQIEVISQNSLALQKSAEAQQQVAKAVEQLTAEVRRR